MEKIEKEIKVTRWVASDGQEFENEYECVKHEDSELGELLTKLKPRTIASFTNPKQLGLGFAFSGEYQWFIMMPKTRTDWALIKRIEELGNCENRVSPGDDKIISIGIRSYCNVICHVKSIDLQKEIMNISNGNLTIVSLIKEEERKVAKK